MLEYLTRMHVPATLNTYGKMCLQATRRWLAALRREYDEGGLALHATSLVYTSLLSLAPLLAVSFSVLKAFGVHNQLEPFLSEVLSPLGEKSEEITKTIIGFVESISVGVLGVIGFAALFYTVVSLLEKIESTFNHIWRVSQSRSLARRFSDFLSVLLLGPVLVFSAVGITASTTHSEWGQRILALQPFGTLYAWASHLLPYLFIILAFAFVYTFIPNTRVRWSAALGGGTIAGLAWKLTGNLFSSFVANSASYSAIYSSFAAVILFMLWLYVSWLILLLGGAIAFHIQYPRYLHYSSRNPRLSILSLEQLGLTLMYLIGFRHYRGEEALTLHRLADAVNLPWEPVGTLLDTLCHHHLLVVTNGDDSAYQLARDTDAIRVRDILSAVRTTGDVRALPEASSTDAVIATDAMRATLESAPDTAHGDMTLRDLFSESSSKDRQQASEITAETPKSR